MCKGQELRESIQSHIYSGLKGWGAWEIRPALQQGTVTQGLDLEASRLELVQSGGGESVEEVQGCWLKLEMWQE